MKKLVENFKVNTVKQLNKEFFVLGLQSEKQLPEILPGQFVQVKIEGSAKTFLRRPISVYDVDFMNRTLWLLVKIAGEGTKQLSRLHPGEHLNIIYPLGNSFSLNVKGKVLLIGGGTGVAPLLFLGKYLKSTHNITPDFLLGYRSKELVIEPEKFETTGNVFITTEDGSLGHKGFVTQHPLLYDDTKKYDAIFTCGPEVMMKAIANYAKAKNIVCEVSLENLMGCGIGACLCCVVDTVDEGNVNTCTEGPVFNIQRLKW
ncbi:MAG: dihydroorotate dehydrogenase electron transfer subunit [Bacteroidales bacterium]|nr:dihydroorotate dehydrogenase electron transfer subunit [Bacteroidales bacterium]